MSRSVTKPGFLEILDLWHFRHKPHTKVGQNHYFQKKTSPKWTKVIENGQGHKKIAQLNPYFNGIRLSL